MITWYTTVFELPSWHEVDTDWTQDPYFCSCFPERKHCVSTSEIVRPGTVDQKRISVIQNPAANAANHVCLALVNLWFLTDHLHPPLLGVKFEPGGAFEANSVVLKRAWAGRIKHVRFACQVQSNIGYPWGCIASNNQWQSGWAQRR